MKRNSNSLKNPTLQAPGNMRRSNSASQIPVYRRDSKVKSTVKSKERESSAESQRKSSLDPKTRRSHSYSSLSRCTPLLNTKTLNKKSYSATKLSPFSRVSCKPSSVKKERPVNDKKWQMEHFSKVQSYLLNELSCDPNIIKNLKPPTINTFVYVCNILFKQIDPRIDISMANYKEAVLVELKTLQYPGHISNSLLKTVNTMHTWPQVVSIFSWLVELLETIETKMNPELSDKNHLIAHVITRYFVKRYTLFNSSQDETEADRSLIAEMLPLYNIDREKKEGLQNRVTELRTLKNKKQEELDKVTEEVNALKFFIDTADRDIQEYNDYCENFEIDYENRKEKLTEEICDMQKRISEVKKTIDSLKDQISKQPCSYEEKLKLKSVIDDLTHTVKLNQEKKESYMQIKDDYDIQLMKYKREIETEIYRINKSLMPLSLIKPEIKSLFLKEQGFCEESFKKDINEFINKKNLIEKQINEELEIMNDEIKSFKTKNKQLKEKIESLERILESSQQKINHLKKTLAKIEAKKKTLLLEFEIQKKEHENKWAILKDKEPSTEDIKELREKLLNFKREKERLTKRFKEYQKSSLKFITDICHISIEDLKELEAVFVNVKQGIDDTKVKVEGIIPVLNNQVQSVCELMDELQSTVNNLNSSVDDPSLISSPL